MDELKVLGIDLACKSWADNGSALLSFAVGGEPGWRECRPGAIDWPAGPLTPEAMARAVDGFAVACGVSAVSIDGPQGWRSPEAGSRRGVGRWCEFQAGTPGKTGEYGSTYPGNYAGWVRFSIEVFEQLAALGNSVLANETDAGGTPLEPLEPGRYYLLECFPTSTWRSSGLGPLPGHRKAPPDIVERYAAALVDRFGLPSGASTRHHDDLQAVVAALPAAALLGGPCDAVPRGQPRVRQLALGDAPDHWVEGLIWDACPRGAAAAAPHPAARAESIREAPGGGTTGPEDDAGDAANPILPDERDPSGDEVIERGVMLFRELVRCANAGHSLGIGYADFVRWVYGSRSFAEVDGHAYVPSDSGFVIRLAQRVTEAAGGRMDVSRGGVTIACGMDTFIWPLAHGHDRSIRAWESNWVRPPYSREDWQKVFPDGTRRLVDPDRQDIPS